MIKKNFITFLSICLIQFFSNSSYSVEPDEILQNRTVVKSLFHRKKTACQLELVFLPISSSSKRLLGVAFLKMFASSSIYTMKVEWPCTRSSCAPTRVNTRSTIPSLADEAGTKQPA